MQRTKDEPIEIKLGDTEFYDAARMASIAFGGIAESLRDAAEQGFTRLLVTRLRSGVGLDSTECEILADLISGRLCRGAGRPRKNATEKQRRRDINHRYKKLREEKLSRAQAIKQVVSEFKPVTAAQVGAIIKDRKMRI
ncbi:helix-loop-helix domain-containing protein [Bradyrhizobium sp. LeoA1S1]